MSSDDDLSPSDRKLDASSSREPRSLNELLEGKGQSQNSGANLSGQQNLIDSSIDDSRLPLRDAAEGGSSDNVTEPRTRRGSGVSIRRIGSKIKDALTPTNVRRSDRGGTQTSNSARQMERRWNDNYQDLFRKISESSLATGDHVRPKFAKPYAKMIMSGKLTRLAIEKGQLDFASKLFDRGYSYEVGKFIEALDEDPFPHKFVKQFIRGAFYSRDTSLKVLYWVLCNREQYSYARTLLDKETGTSLNDYREKYDLKTDEDMHDFNEQTSVLLEIKSLALDHGFDGVATQILQMIAQTTLEECQCAMKTCCLNFLKEVWSKEIPLRKKMAKKSTWVTDNMSIDLTKSSGSGLGKEDKLRFVNIFKYYLITKKPEVASQLLDWEGSENEYQLLKLCLQYGAQELIHKLLRQYIDLNITPSPDDLGSAIRGGHYEIAIELIRFPEVRMALSREETQDKLIQMLRRGNTIHYAAELFSVIPIKSVKDAKVGVICDVMNDFLNDSVKELIMCYSPLLTTVLLAEFFGKLALKTRQYKPRCLGIQQRLLDLSHQIQSGFSDELDLKFFLNQKDKQRRSVLYIMSINRYYKLLDNDTIGTIVSQMWNGRNKNHSLWLFSSLYSMLSAPLGSPDVINLDAQPDIDIPYVFQYEQWISSCYLRSQPENCSVILLAFFYMWMTYRIVMLDAFDDIMVTTELKTYLTIAIFWSFSVNIKNATEFFFAFRTSREFRVDIWITLDLLSLILMIMLAIDLPYFMIHENDLRSQQYQDSYYERTFLTSILNAVVLGLTWGRLVGVLMLNRYLGPILRMIYLVFREVFIFLVVFLAWGILAAGILCSVFYLYKDDFETQSGTYLNIFETSLGNYDIHGWRRFSVFGIAVYAVIITICAIVMINFLVAILTNIYMDIHEKAEAEHRVAILRKLHRMTWDSRFGFLIFVYSPLNLISLLFVPFIIFPDTARDFKSWNDKLCKSFFVIIYALPFFIVFLVMELILLPFVWLKGWISSIQHNGRIMALRFLIWLFFGLFILLKILAADMVTFWQIIFVENRNYSIKYSQKSGMVKYLDSKFMKDVQNILSSLVHTKYMTAHTLYGLWEKSESEEDQVANIEHFHEELKLLDRSKNTQKKLWEDDSDEGIAFEFKDIVANKQVGRPARSVFHRYPGQDLKSTNHTSTREDAARLFFYLYSFNSDTQNIDLRVMRALLPKKHHYTEGYLYRSFCFNIRSMNKVLKDFTVQSNQGSSSMFLMMKKQSREVDRIRRDQDKIFRVLAEIKLQLGGRGHNSGNVSLTEVAIPHTDSKASNLLNASRMTSSGIQAFVDRVYEDEGGHVEVDASPGGGTRLRVRRVSKPTNRRPTIRESLEGESNNTSTSNPRDPIAALIYDLKAAKTSYLSDSDTDENLSPITPLNMRAHKVDVLHEDSDESLGLDQALRSLRGQSKLGLTSTVQSQNLLTSSIPHDNDTNSQADEETKSASEADKTPMADHLAGQDLETYRDATIKHDIYRDSDSESKSSGRSHDDRDDCDENDEDDGQRRDDLQNLSDVPSHRSINIMERSFTDNSMMENTLLKEKKPATIED